jgi:hypothetical protein
MTLRALLRYIGGFFAGLVAAAIISFLLYAVVPKPNGPPDQHVGHIMGFTFCVFPLLALNLGVFGVYVVIARRNRRP